MSDFHKIVVPRTAHFYTLGTASTKVKNLWIVCHGMGQNADDFIKNFEGIADDENFVVAPEGLNKSYWNGFDGPAVASWMTRRHRLDEIADFSHFIHSIYHHYILQCAENVKITLLGFSQGCATQVRFVMDRLPNFDSLVLCGGGMPEDLDYLSKADYWSDKKIYFLCGDKDKFITPDRIAAHEQMLANHQLFLTEKIIFDGKHELKNEPLQQLKHYISEEVIA
jgi:predicted esterase